MNVFIIDDNDVNRFVLEKRLAKLGFTTTGFSNPIEVINLCKAGHLRDINFILMDIRMPLLDGVSATRILRDLGFNKPILAVTAEPLADQSERMLFDEIQLKPVAFKELIIKIERSCC